MRDFKVTDNPVLVINENNLGCVKPRLASAEGTQLPFVIDTAGRTLSVQAGPLLRLVVPPECHDVGLHAYRCYVWECVCGVCFLCEIRHLWLG